MRNTVFLTCALLIVKLQVASSQSGGCEAGWFRSPEKCFSLFGTDIDGVDRLTRSKADEACREMGATLAMIPNQETQPILTAILAQAPSSHVWIGLSDLTVEGTFVWIDGSNLTGFTNWGQSQPDNGQGFEEDCVYLRANEDYPGEWYDGYCDYPRAYICEKPQDPAIPTVSPSVACGMPLDKQYVLFERACYKLDLTPRSYQDSVQYCSDDGTEIISIYTAFEEAFVEALLLNAGASNAWIGLKLQLLVGNLIWNDDLALTYTNWAQYRPEMTTNCSILTVAGWEDEGCNAQHPVLCKSSSGKDPDLPIPLRGSQCPDGTHQLDDQYCSATNLTQYTWEVAQQLCTDIDSTSFLASIHNINEEGTLAGFLVPGQEAWIGLHSSDRDQYIWADGSVLDYVNFNGSPNERCVAITRLPTGIFEWNARDCITTLGYICRAPKYFIPPVLGGCSPDWYHIGNQCFRSVGVREADRRDYADAQEYCVSQGAGRGRLFHADTQIRQSFLSFVLQDFVEVETNLWIGLSDSETEGMFVWSDGTPLGAFTQWAPNQPDGFTAIPTEPFRDCVEVRSDPNQLGLWDDINCLEQRGFICETYLDDQLPSNDSVILEMCDGSHSDYMKYKDSCYKVINETLSFDAAQTRCGVDNAWVTKARDGFYNSLLTLIIHYYLTNPEPVWISLRQDNSDTYEWVQPSGQDMWPLTYARWDKGMPSGDACTILQADSTWLNAPCDDQNYVICEYSTTTPNTESTVHCPQGWTIIDRHCYKFDTLSPEQPQLHFTFAEAQYECKERYDARLPGTHSASANAEFRREALDSLGNRNVWLGLHRSVDGYYAYDDGRIIDYVNWGSGSNMEGSQCFALDTETGNWLNTHCFSMAGLVCETDALPGEANLCPESWLNNLDACYYVSDANDEDSWMSWHAAQQFCNMNRGHLTPLGDGSEKDYIKSLLVGQTEAFWIGLNNIETHGEWVWADGTDYDSMADEWSADDIRNENNMEYCVVINEDGEWEDHNCGIRRPFICKWDTIQQEPIVDTQEPPAGECSPGSYRLKDRCYDLTSIGEQRTWLDAHKECLFRSAELAAIHDSAVQAFLSTYLRNTEGNVWIGMTRYGKYDQYYWSDGSTVGFTNWALGEPNSPFQQEGNENSFDSCVEMVNNPNYAGKWSDVDCNTEKGFICEKPLDVTQVEQPLPFQLCPGSTEYLSYKKSCFKIVTYTAHNPNAESECMDDGGHLASIEDAYELAFIEMLMAYMNVESAWIGLKRGSTDQFEWLDGWPTVFTSWMAGHPTGANDLTRCVIMTLDGWRNVECYDAHNAVCKTTTAAVPSPPQLPSGQCPNGWIEYRGACYFFDTERTDVSYPEAVAFCQAKGPDYFPVSSQNSEVNTFLQNTARSELQVSMLWLGLFHQDGEFKWSDGSPYVYTNWRSDLPNMPIEGDACVHLTTEGSGLWMNVDCFVRAGYACQGPFISTTTPMPTTERAKPPAEPQEDVLSLEAIIGISVGGGVLVLLVVLSFACYMAEKSKETYKQKNNPDREASRLS